MYRIGRSGRQRIMDVKVILYYFAIVCSILPSVHAATMEKVWAVCQRTEDQGDMGSCGGSSTTALWTHAKEIHSCGSLTGSIPPEIGALKKLIDERVEGEPARAQRHRVSNNPLLVVRRSKTTFLLSGSNRF